MALGGKSWYYSSMRDDQTIPAFGLYGDPEHFPDVLHCELLSARAPIHDWSILAHRHDQMSQIFLISDGYGAAKIDGVNHTVSSGDFLYIPEYCVHEFMFRPKTDGMVVSFPLSVVRSVSPNTDDILAALSTPIAGRACQRLSQTCQMLRDSAQSSSTFRAQQIVGLAHSVLALIAEQKPLFDGAQPFASAKPERLLALDRLIRQHMAEGWSASDYAKAQAITPGHLSRLCRAATGRGANSYIESRLMEEACRLLAFTQLPVSQIGYRLGYSDPSYFSKRFRIAQRQAPTAYRAMFSSQ